MRSAQIHRSTDTHSRQNNTLPQWDTSTYCDVQTLWLRHIRSCPVTAFCSLASTPLFVLLQGLERLHAADTPLPAAAAAVDLTSSLLSGFSGWGSWLGSEEEDKGANKGAAQGPGKQQTTS